VSLREIFLCDVNAMESNLPYAQTLIRIRSKQSEKSKWENRYYISSAQRGSKTPSQWAQNIRDHWSVENKTHWRKDATLREDKTRSRKPRILSNLVLLRNLVLHYYEPHRETYEWLPHWIEKNQGNPQDLIALVTQVQRK
jgi:predicted transposase YbfD/YdcC